MDNNQLSLFDYNQLDSRTREIVKKNDLEYDSNMDNASTNFIEACKNQEQINNALRYKKPGYVEYLENKGIPKNTAYRMLNIAKMFTNLGNISIESKSALYLLAAPSTPEEARTEILERAENGETILYAQVKQTVDEYKKPNSIMTCPACNNLYDSDKFRHCPYCYKKAHGLPNGWTEGLPELVNNNTPLFADDTHLNEALEDERKPVCQKCGLVYDGHSCPDCNKFIMPDVIRIQAKCNNDWYTPIEYIESVRNVLGEIDLDPATAFEVNKTIQAKNIFTIDDNGLTKNWYGKVWLNPPYGRESGEFSLKLVQEFNNGVVTEAILLVNANSTDTSWFQPLWEYTLCFTNHRINFLSPNNENPSGSTHGSVFIYFGNNEKIFIKEFSKFGAVVKRVKTDE